MTVVDSKFRTACIMLQDLEVRDRDKRQARDSSHNDLDLQIDGSTTADGVSI